MADVRAVSMVGGTIPPMSDSPCEFQSFGPQPLWQRRGAHGTEEQNCVFTTPSLLSRGTPSRVLRHHAEDQVAHFLRDPLPAEHLTDSGQDTPIQGESGSVPTDDGLGADDDQSLFPSGPEPSCQDPEDLIEGS